MPPRCRSRPSSAGSGSWTSGTRARRPTSCPGCSASPGRSSRSCSAWPWPAWSTGTKRCAPPSRWARTVPGRWSTPPWICRSASWTRPPPPWTACSPRPPWCPSTWRPARWSAPTSTAPAGPPPCCCSAITSSGTRDRCPSWRPNWPPCTSPWPPDVLPHCPNSRSSTPITAPGSSMTAPPSGSSTTGANTCATCPPSPRSPPTAPAPNCRRSAARSTGSPCPARSPRPSGHWPAARTRRPSWCCSPGSRSPCTAGPAGATLSSAPR